MNTLLNGDSYSHLRLHNNTTHSKKCQPPAQKLTVSHKLHKTQTLCATNSSGTNHLTLGGIGGILRGWLEEVFQVTYIIKSYSLPQEFIDSEIENALNTLYSTNEMVFDYWLTELYDDEDEKLTENWTEGTMKELYKDVDYNVQEVLISSKEDKVLERVM